MRPSNTLILALTLAASLSAPDASAAAAANTWLGKSPNWSDPANWSLGAAPTDTDNNDTIIPGGCAHHPVLDKDAKVSGALTVESGACLDIGAHVLEAWSSNPERLAGLVNHGRMLAAPGSGVTVGRSGFVNQGRIEGELRLAFLQPYYGAELAAGGAAFASLTLGEANPSHVVSLSGEAVVKGNLALEGGRLTINPGAKLTIQGDLEFRGKGKGTASLCPLGDTVLLGNLRDNGSALCGGGVSDTTHGRVTLASSGDQQIRGQGLEAVLPPLRIAKPSGTAILSGDLACATLQVDSGNTLDATAAKTIQFGGAGANSPHCEGFVNAGTLKGTPSLVFAPGCFQACLEPGGAPLANLTIATGHFGYQVLLKSALSLDGDLELRSGSLNAQSHTITIRGSCRLPPFSQPPASGVLTLREGQRLVFAGPAPAVLEAGGAESNYHYSTCLQDLVVDKPEGAFAITRAPLAVRGTLQAANGLDFRGGGELWLGTRWSRQQIDDPGLRLTRSITKAEMPEIVPTPAPQAPPDVVPRPDTVVGPPLPPGLKLANIARLADITTFPYTTMARLFVDHDPLLRTCALPETASGSPAAAAFRYEFRFSQPQEVAQVRWSVPSGPWALLADTAGKGGFDRLLRLDLAGKVDNRLLRPGQDAQGDNPCGVWRSRAWLTNNFQPPVKVYAVQLVSLGAPLYLHDFQILAPTGAAPASPEAKPSGPTLQAGEPVQVAAPPVADQYLKGFHIEPWMFGVQGWLQLAKAKRPPFTEFQPFLDFVRDLKKVHANIVNLWTPKTFLQEMGKGTYEYQVLWPSQYDKWSLDENVLELVAQAFHAHGLKLLVMDRCVYPKELKDFPRTDTSDKPAPVIPRRDREYLKGLILEEVASGVDGVGVGYDEQMSGIGNPKDPCAQEAFQAAHHLAPPAQAEDTEAYRHWVVFNYEQFAAFLGEAAAAAKRANPQVIVKCPAHLCLGNLWNCRMDLGIAEDIAGHEAKLDFIRAYNYECFDNLGHYVSAANTKRMAGANPGRWPDSLHNCPWANDPKTAPGYYLDFTPAHMRGSILSSVMHGSRLPLVWRYNFIFRGGYEKYVEQAYSMLDTLAAWDGREAAPPKQILVLKSRASEDWWQLRQRLGDGKPQDQYRGFLHEKWLLEFLLTNGYQFELRYLDHPGDFERQIADYPLVVLPFPYSLSDRAAQALRKSRRLLTFGRIGETDEWGNPRPSPALAPLVASGQAELVGDDLPVVGHHRAFETRMKDTFDRLLGEDKLLDFDSFGADVEAVCLERRTGELFLLLTNWTDRPQAVQLGLRLPGKGTYELAQRDPDGALKLSLGGDALPDAKALRRFQAALEGFESKIIHVKPKE